ncbi:MAG: cyclic nucleotide-binding domain-containing protein [bacterium]
MQTLETVLKTHSFFRDLKQEYLELALGCATNVVFKPGEIILKEGKPADRFFLIREGRIAIEVPLESQRSITIQTIQGGDILGWSWLIPPHQNKFNCRTLDLTRAIALDGKCLREKCEKNHDLGYDLLMRIAKVFTSRLEATRLQLLNLYER